MAVKMWVGPKFCYSSFCHISKMDMITVLHDLALNGTSGMYNTTCFKKFQELVYYTEISKLTSVYITFPSSSFLRQ
jgi:hypothetical protein